MNRRAALVAIPCVTIVASLALLRAAGPGASENPVPTSVHIELPATVAAGDTVEGTITAEGTDRLDVVVATATAAFDFSIPVAGGIAPLVLGPAVTGTAGLVSVMAATAGGPLLSTFTVVPGPAAEIDPLAGPRTIVADGADETMVVTVPLDTWGNPLPDGTLVSVGVVRSDGTTETNRARTRGGIAAVRLASTTAAGPIAISATSGAAAGPAVRVDQVAGTAEPFTLTLAPEETRRLLLADGRTLHRLVTSELVDGYGNILPDGVGVRGPIDGPSGPGVRTAVITNGRAEIHLEAPTAPGAVTVGASIDGVAAMPVTLRFTSAVDHVPADVGRAGDLLLVSVGPVLGTRGAFVPDGTTVTIDGADATIQDGTTVIELPLPAAGTTLEMDVLGHRSTLVVPPWN